MDVSFSADQLRRVLGSAEGRQLLALLAADGGGRLRQAGKADKKQEALLLALKPFLRKDRQSKIDRALQAARLASLASLALKNRGRGPGPKETP